MARMSEVLTPAAHGVPHRQPTSGKAVASVVLGALSLVTPVYFLVILALQALNPQSLIGYAGLFALMSAPVGVMLAGVGLWLGISARRGGARATVGVVLCVIGLVACLATIAYFRPWAW